MLQTKCWVLEAIQLEIGDFLTNITGKQEVRNNNIMFLSCFSGLCITSVAL